MRVESIISINAHQKHNQHTVEYAGNGAGKTISGIAFEDYLRAKLQQVNVPVVSRQTENQLAGLLIGYFTPPRLTLKEETKTEINAG